MLYFIKISENLQYFLSVIEKLKIFYRLFTYYIILHINEQFKYFEHKCAIICNMNIAESLKQCREERGLNPNELARALGVNHQNIYRWESGKFLPGIEMCIKLADYYGISLDELVGRNF